MSVAGSVMLGDDRRYSEHGPRPSAWSRTTKTSGAPWKGDRKAGKRSRESSADPFSGLVVDGPVWRHGFASGFSNSFGSGFASAFGIDTSER